jgi:hypothetical protein
MLHIICIIIRKPEICLCLEDESILMEPFNKRLLSSHSKIRTFAENFAFITGIFGYVPREAAAAGFEAAALSHKYGFVLL